VRAGNGLVIGPSKRGYRERVIFRGILDQKGPLATMGEKWAKLPKTPKKLKMAFFVTSKTSKNGIFAKFVQKLMVPKKSFFT
jgi:hypothetical protein